MDINIVPRTKIKKTKKRSSKYQNFLDALQKVEPGGKALEISFSNTKELTALRNILYNYNRKKNDHIQSSRHFKKNLLYVYK